ncbi:hypothetical protein EJ05DRAFT_489894 [Pseudovirgaria hyperparasitica]|uniref:Integral membrane bound transporter domain-containing protein n=1 Tax=Pseudovirgaria hyperparasitica TaxID=470096 RepID=A0A6A6VWV1_9PEZI|nr:uncharacterized protein EJ05DRAFT_489894 [Pseudovirgaria hyperparasitica]KAF2753721.1 hypothetical protein EJ05DRAFT_489894 [Pseudovirgaria hyperparasitica]
MPDEQEASTSRRVSREPLRQATLILPKTGERVKRAFTLGVQAVQNGHVDAQEHMPLLGADTGHGESGPRNKSLVWEKTKETGVKLYDFITSPLGQGILKCSLAYILGSLGTFYPPISGWLGHQDGKHMMATVTVYFHPARSAGSMEEAFFIALVAFSYAAVISFTSMAVSAFFASQHLLQLGHAVVLIVFCGGGLGLVGWTKQALSNPLVNVGCSLTSLALITVLTKEGAVQNGTFSYAKIYQVLKMVSLGILSTALVSFLVKPISARKELRKDFKTATVSLSEMVALITKSFLDGDEEELEHTSFMSASSSYKTIFKRITKDLGEAKWEHYTLGTEETYHIEAKLAKALEQLSVDVSGLRSAAATQFALMKAQADGKSIMSGMSATYSDLSPSASRSHDYFATLRQRLGSLASIDENPRTKRPEHEDGLTMLKRGQTVASTMESSTVITATTAAEIFQNFLSQLGPPMKSLAFTLKAVLEELPFGPPPTYSIVVNEQFRKSLVDANELFTTARKEALSQVYQSKVPSHTKAEIAADYEEVAASCGYFSSSLQDFAEDLLEYIDILEEYKHVAESPSVRRSWKWLMFWRKRNQKQVADEAELFNTPTPPNPPKDLLKVTHRTLKGASRNVTWNYTDELQSEKKRRPITYRLWVALRFFRRDDIKFALKVGVGAILYAMWSFIPSTRPVYASFRGEWGLLSYMLVCSMTVGASNTTGFHRFGGTCLGALLAVLAWIIADENPFVLAFFGWVVSLGCFYIIVGQGKGPLGRFILLTYNLSALYAYSLSVKDDDNDDDEGGISPEIWEIVFHRVVAVLTGCLWGMVITRLIWPISARRKLKDGLAILWLRMGLIWKRDPLAVLLRGPSRYSYMDIGESLSLQRFLNHLDGLRASAASEFELRGPFPNRVCHQLLESTGRMLDAFHAMNVIIRKELKATPGEQEILQYTRYERIQLSSRISHLFSVLASSLKLEYPLNDTMPNIEHTRDRLLAKVFDFRKNAEGRDLPTDEDYELLYAYALVTGQLAHEIGEVAALIETLYGVLDEETFKLE